MNFSYRSQNDETIRKYFNPKWYPESLYLLAMVDYLSRENDLPLCQEYDDIRAHKLVEPLFLLSVVMADDITGSDKWKAESIHDAIPEFLRFNIVEGDIRNII